MPYKVPMVLRDARVARKLPIEERSVRFGPSELYFTAKAEVGDDEKLVTALFLHAMYEVGYIGPPGTGEDKAFVGMPVCPICGFVFEETTITGGDDD